MRILIAEDEKRLAETLADLIEEAGYYTDIADNGLDGLELSDRVRGLDAGADYYLTKPFENEEFLACLRTVLRRQADIIPDTSSIGDLTLNPSVSKLCCNGCCVSLSAKELELMRLLIQNHTQFFSKETLFLKVWGYDSNVNANSVEAQLLHPHYSFL